MQQSVDSKSCQDRHSCHQRHDEALTAFSLVAKLEGILPAIESSHALAHALKTARGRSREEVIVVCLSGRGDKDVYEVARLTGQDV